VDFAYESSGFFIVRLQLRILGILCVILKHVFLEKLASLVGGKAVELDFLRFDEATSLEHLQGVGEGGDFVGVDAKLVAAEALGLQELVDFLEQEGVIYRSGQLDVSTMPGALRLRQATRLTIG